MSKTVNMNPESNTKITAPEVLVGLEDLAIGYRQGRRSFPLNSGIRCNVYRGELVSLMGRNGSGKSTLLRTIAGLHPALQGRIAIGGKFIEDFQRHELARMLGFVSTEVIRVQGLRVKDLVSMGRYPHTGWFGNLSQRDYDKIREAIELTSLEELVDRDLDELSDGERQRAMIARTIAQDSSILILDEPTAFLDLTHRHEITMLLRRLARDHGKTIVFSSHDLQLSLKLADKIWLMHEGGIHQAAPEDLMLDGRLEKGLLEDSAVGGLKMDPLSAEIELEQDFLLEAGLQSSSEKLFELTRKALERNGIRVKKGAGAGLQISITGESPVWSLEKAGKVFEYNSIYDLSLHMQTIINQIKSS